MGFREVDLEGFWDRAWIELAHRNFGAESLIVGLQKHLGVVGTIGWFCSKPSILLHYLLRNLQTLLLLLIGQYYSWGVPVEAQRSSPPFDFVTSRTASSRALALSASGLRRLLSFWV